jgi:WD repeat-containing protein 68
MPSAYSQGDELHLAGMPLSSPAIQHTPSSSRDYGSSSSGVVVPTQMSSPSHFTQQHQHQHQPPPPTTVPNVLQPAGGLAPRPPPLSANTAPALPTMQMQMSPQQVQEYRPPPAPPSSSVPHAYPRSSPAVNVNSGIVGVGAGGSGSGSNNNYGEGSYQPYTPTTPAGSGPSFTTPEARHSNMPSGTQRIPNAPLGLADIRPRADSSISDGTPGTLAYELAHSQPGTSNYLAPWTAYAFDWCKWAPHANSAGKLALCSYLEDGHNFIHVLEGHVIPTPQDAYVPGTSKYSLEFTKVAEATHSFPVTRLLWEPQSSQKQSTDLLATSGDHLRLWSLPSEAPSPQSNSITRGDRNTRPPTKLTPLALLSNSKTPDHTAPLTSLDWNTIQPNLIITSSIDTTCTIWDIPSLTAKTQLIAHDKEVYDVRFCANSTDVFVSCGQDGSVRMFDLRSLEHSTIIYEPNAKDERDANGARMSPTLAQQTMSTPQPLLRLATSPHDTHLLATFAQDSNVVRLLDVRQPGQALFELRGHGGPINCIEWSPHRRGILASGGDDCQVLLWDLFNPATQTVNGSGQTEPHRNPIASWQCDFEVGNLGWVPRLSNQEYGDWLGVSAGRGIWGVRMG